MSEWANLEQENAKLLSKLAFNEMELKNCKSELDLLTIASEKHRQTTDELQKIRNEVFAKEEDNYSLKAKVRSFELEAISLRDELQSKSIDWQRQKLRMQEDLDGEKGRATALESQINSLQQIIQSRDAELQRLRSEHSAMFSACDLSENKELIAKKEELELKLAEVEREVRVQAQNLIDVRNNLVESRGEVGKLRQKLSESEKQTNEFEYFRREARERDKIKDKEAENLHKSLLDSQNALKSLEETHESCLLQLKKTQESDGLLQQKLEERSTECSRLSTELLERNNEIDSLSGALRRVRTELEHLQSCQAVTTNHCSDNDILMSQTNAKIASYQEECNSLREKLKALQSELVSTRSQSEMASLSTKALEVEVEQWKSKAKQLDEQVHEINSMGQQNDLKNATRLMHFKELSNRIGNMEKENAEFLESFKREENLRRLSEEKAKYLSLQLMDIQRSVPIDTLSVDSAKEIVDRPSNEEGRLAQQRLETMEIERNKFHTDWQEQFEKVQVLERQLLVVSTEHKIELKNLEQRLLQQLSQKSEAFEKQSIQLQMFEIERKQLSNALEVERNRVQAFQREIAELNGESIQTNTLRSECAMSVQTIEAREKAVATLQLRVNDLEAECAKLEVHVESSSRFEKLLLVRDNEVLKLRNDLSSAMSSNIVCQAELSAKRSEVEAVEDRLKSSNAENENLQREVFRLKSELSISSSNLENEKNKRLIADMEIQHLNDMLQNTNSHSESKDADKDRLRMRVRECELENEQKQRLILQLQSDLTQIREDASDYQQQLKIELENGAQKDKKIRSFREELLQLQKRMTERETERETDAFSRPLCVSKSVQTEESVSRTLGSALIAPHSHITESREREHLQTTGSSIKAELQRHELAGIRSELDQRRAESTALFELIKQYEGSLTRLVNAQSAATIQTEHPRKAGGSCRTQVVTEEHKRLYDDLCEQIDTLPVSSEFDSGDGIELDSSDDLKSLSDLRSTTQALQRFSGDKLLENMSKMFSNVTSFVYALRMRNMKKDRLMCQSIDEPNAGETLILMRSRVDGETEFLQKLSEMANRGKTFVRDGRSEVEKMKARWKRSNGHTADKIAINSLTEDLNLMIRFVRAVQDSIQTRSSLLKDIKNRIASSSKRSNSTDKLRSTREKFSALDKDLVHFSDEIADLLHPVFSTSLPTSSSLFVPSIAPPARLQNFMVKESENLYPVPSSSAIVCPRWESNHFSIASGTTAMRENRNRLQEIQQQLLAAQDRQIDSFKECDKHVSWLGNLMKEIDQTAAKGRGTGATSMATKVIEGDHFII